MKKLFFIPLLLTACLDKNDDWELSQMKSPVIMIGKNSIANKDGGTPIVTVRDAKGKVCSFYENAIAISLMSRNIGDTIK